MALDSTLGGTESESYVSVADADTYAEKIINNDWLDADEEEKEAALRKATAWIDSKYRGQWKGEKADKDQALAWPRQHADDEDGHEIDADIIPRVLIHATCEAAFRELVTPNTLFPDQDRQTKSEKVGPIAIEYVAGAPTRTEITAAQDLLTGLLIGGSSTSVSFLLRA